MFCKLAQLLNLILILHVSQVLGLYQRQVLIHHLRLDFNASIILALWEKCALQRIWLDFCLSLNLRILNLRRLLGLLLKVDRRHLRGVRVSHLHLLHDLWILLLLFFHVHWELRHASMLLLLLRIYLWRLLGLRNRLLWLFKALHSHLRLIEALSWHLHGELLLRICLKLCLLHIPKSFLRRHPNLRLSLMWSSYIHTVLHLLRIALNLRRDSRELRLLIGHLLSLHHHMSWHLRVSHHLSRSHLGVSLHLHVHLSHHLSVGVLKVLIHFNYLGARSLKVKTRKFKVIKLYLL